jgi:hypothetical protein
MVATLAVLPVVQIPLLLAHPGRTWQMVVAGGLFVQMSTVAACGTTQRSVRQIVCAEQYQARMQQISTMAVLGSRPLAAVVAGAVVACAGIRPVFYAATTLLLAPAFILIRSPAARLRHLPGAPQVQHTQAHTDPPDMSEALTHTPEDATSALLSRRAPGLARGIHPVADASSPNPKLRLAGTPPKAVPPLSSFLAARKPPPPPSASVDS